MEQPERSIPSGSPGWGVTWAWSGGHGELSGAHLLDPAFQSHLAMQWQEWWDQSFNADEQPPQHAGNEFLRIDPFVELMGHFQMVVSQDLDLKAPQVGLWNVLSTGKDLSHLK